jgi:hypothetical protein
MIVASPVWYPYHSTRLNMCLCRHRGGSSGDGHTDATQIRRCFENEFGTEFFPTSNPL